MGFGDAGSGFGDFDIVLVFLRRCFVDVGSGFGDLLEFINLFSRSHLLVLRGVFVGDLDIVLVLLRGCFGDAGGGFCDLFDAARCPGVIV